MTKCDKLLQKARNNPAGLRFPELAQLAEGYGFYFHRQSGTSHAIYKREGSRARLNLQPEKNGKAKPYQVRQVLAEIGAILRERGEA